MKTPLKFCVIVLAIGAGVSARTQDVSLQQLYERHSWFELRDAIAGRTVSPLYSGFVASAFNRTRDAENLLSRAVREAAASEAVEAREALLNLYMRLGRSADMLRVLDEMLAATPSSDDLRNARELFQSLRGVANQSVRAGRHRSFAC